MRKIKEFLIRGVSPIVTIIIIAIIGIIVASSILAYIYLWHPAEPQAIIASDETASWKTYRNEELGFEFKYPSSWNVISPNVHDFTLSFLSQNGSLNIQNVVNVEILHSTQDKIYQDLQLMDVSRIYEGKKVFKFDFQENPAVASYYYITNPERAYYCGIDAYVIHGDYLFSLQDVIAINTINYSGKEWEKCRSFLSSTSPTPRDSKPELAKVGSSFKFIQENN
jgi:hypothetical protein